MERIFVKTDRLTTETWRRELSEALCLLSQDAGNRKFLPDEVFQTMEEAQAAIAQWLHNWEAAAGEQACPIFLKEGACIGHIALSPLEDWDGEAWEVTCHIGAAFRGHGYAVEAMQAFLPAIMARCGITEVHGICTKDNLASRRVMEQCGFQKYREKDVIYYGEPKSDLFYRYTISTLTTHI